MTRDWAEQDPAGYVAGLNRYSFANANPIVLNDPDGFQPRDKYFGKPDRFWDWYHRQIKQPGDPDLTKPEADDYEQQWEDEGKPDGEGKTQKKLICSLATIADITAQIAAEAAAAEARAAADRLRQLGKEIGNHIGDWLPWPPIPGIPTPSGPKPSH